MTVWMVRAGTRGEREDLALEEGLVCVGWDEVPDIATYGSRDAIFEQLSQIYPERIDAPLSTVHRRRRPLPGGMSCRES